MIKTWYLICSLFLLYSISILESERYEVAYAKSKNHDLLKNYSVCIPLSELINLQQFGKPQITLQMLNNQIKKYFKNLSDEFVLKGEILNKIENGLTYYHFYHFCLYLNINSSRLFEKFSENVKFFLFSRNPYTFFANNLPSIHANEIIILNREWPYSSCRMKRLDKPHKQYVKFNCINKCLKANNGRLLKYFYNLNETENVILAHNESEVKLNEDKCFKEQCAWNDCILRKFIHRNFNSSEIGTTKVFKAYSLMSSFAYYNNLIGLIFLFFGISVFDTLPFLTKSLVDALLNEELRCKASRKIKIKNVTQKLKLIFIVSCLILNLAIFYKMIETYIFENTYPLEREYVNLVYDPFSIAICVPAEKSAANQIQNRTMQQLENETSDLLNETIEEAFAIFINTKDDNLEFKLTNKVLFKYDEAAKSLLRCFEFTIKADKINFQTLFYDSKLILKSRKSAATNFSIFIFANDCFTSKSLKFTMANSFLKKFNYSAEASCKDYSNEEVCASQASCIEKCVSKRIMTSRSCLSISTILNKKHFNEAEWSGRICEFEDEKIRKEIVRNCEQTYTEIDCKKIEFELSDQTYLNATKKPIKIDLFFEIITYLNNYPSEYQLLLDMLNVMSILFSLNAFKLLEVSFEMARNHLKWLKFAKFYKLLVYALCLSGFFYHSQFIFSEFGDYKMLYDEFYEPSDTFLMPDLLFCFQLNELSLDSNFKKTASYLNKLTNDRLNENLIFENIIYLNERREWTSYNSSSNSVNFVISVLYYQNLKCFQISHKISYEKKDFYFKASASVMKIKFNKTFLNENNEMLFLNRVADTRYFTKLILLNYENNANKSMYSIIQEVHDIEYDDNFKFIKRLLKYGLDFSEQATFEEKFNEFKCKCKCTTDLFELSDVDFRLEIQNQLFNQFMIYFKHKLDREFLTFQFKMKFPINYYAKIKRSDQFDFQFVPGFITKKFIIHNVNN